MQDDKRKLGDEEMELVSGGLTFEQNPEDTPP